MDKINTLFCNETADEILIKDRMGTTISLMQSSTTAPAMYNSEIPEILDSGRFIDEI